MERRPWAPLAGPPLTVSGIGVALRIYAAGQGRPMNPDLAIRMAWILWALAAAWTGGATLWWYRDRRRRKADEETKRKGEEAARMLDLRFPNIK